MIYDALVYPQTLNEHLHDPNWIVVDCRHQLGDFSAGRRDYDAAHVPGAFFADVENDLSGAKAGTNGRHPLPPREQFLAYLRGIGANDDSQIVAYDVGADMFAARFWFMVRQIGHAAVAVLDAGIMGWQAAGFPVTADVTPVPKAGTISLRAPLDGTVDAEHIARQLGNSSDVLLDARAAERYRGEVEPLDPVAGHIPGARNRNFKENFDANGRWKSPEVLRAELAAFGDPSRIVNYCGSGVSAAANLLAMRVAGLDGARMYPGGWSEWSSDPSRPVEPKR